MSILDFNNHSNLHIHILEVDYLVIYYEKYFEIRAEKNWRMYWLNHAESLVETRVCLIAFAEISM